MRKTALIFMATVFISGILTACGSTGSKGVDLVSSAISYEEVQDADIFVEKIDDLSEDFLRGVDISSYLSEVESGVQFKDFDGNILDEQGFFNLLAKSGVNCVRIRVWNDPYDANGNGYGGGNCDIDRAVTMGQFATKAGMKVLIDFHYSDFWADPKKQMSPKAWADMDINTKSEAIATYTAECMEKLYDASVNLAMIQIGNETNSAMCGEKNWDKITMLMKSAGAAARKVATDKNKELLIAVHFANPENPEEYIRRANRLKNDGVDYDVFASSYYPYWHGTLDNLTDILGTIAKEYDKKVMVVETSWAYTLDEGDGSGNTVSVGSNDVNPAYSFSVQGQANEVVSVIKAVHAVGDAGIGVFYWEPAWIPAEKSTWESKGSGWASSFAGDYDPEDAGKYYGGSAVDNQAMFDFDGNPLPSLNVWKYVYSGAKSANVTVDRIPDVLMSADPKYDIITLFPTTVEAVFSDGSTSDVSVAWDEAAIAKCKDFGVYTIPGTVTLDDGSTDTAKVQLTLEPENFLKNGGFENGHADWDIDGNGIDDQINEDPFSGAGSLHFYSTKDLDFTATQSFTAQKSCQMGAYLYVQGGDLGENHGIELSVENKTTGETMSGSTTVDGWIQWKTVDAGVMTMTEGDEITVTIHGYGRGGGWGTIDDVCCYDAEG